MSYEIRTPMNGLLGINELALGIATGKEPHDYLSTAQASGETLLSVINDILDFKKVEAAQIQLEQEPFDIFDCIERTIKITAINARKKGLKLQHSISKNVPKFLMGDSNRFRQVMLNLLNNAIKFTDEGKVTLKLDSTEQIGSLKTLNFKISDTGIGMPSEQLDSIFNPFQQAESSISRRFGGTGLVLAICQHTIKEMGGDTTVTSKLGSGSEFSFRIQLTIAEMSLIPTEWEKSKKKPLEL